jgi:hypothetical protein
MLVQHSISEPTKAVSIDLFLHSKKGDNIKNFTHDKLESLSLADQTLLLYTNFSSKATGLLIRCSARLALGLVLVLDKGSVDFQ